MTMLAADYGGANALQFQNKSPFWSAGMQEMKLAQGSRPGAMTPWLVHELRDLGLEVVCLDARPARAALEMQINKTDPERRGRIGSDRSHRVVPVCSCQVVRKPPRACSSGRKASVHRHDSAIVQPHPEVREPPDRERIENEPESFRSSTR
jgi:transposase